ncbi:unnamed protein product, partial [marine sediment metagenome]
MVREKQSMSYFYTESDIVTYQNNLIIYMWDRKETTIPEKQTTRKPKSLDIAKITTFSSTVKLCER